MIVGTVVQTTFVGTTTTQVLGTPVPASVDGTTILVRVVPTVELDIIDGFN